MSNRFLHGGPHKVRPTCGAGHVGPAVPPCGAGHVGPAVPPCGAGHVGPAVPPCGAGLVRPTVPTCGAGLVRPASPLWRFVAALLAIALVATAVVSAHEIGTTRVAIRLHDGRYDVEIVTDGAALLDKLETVSGQQPSADRSAAHIRASLARYDEPFRGRVRIVIDGVAAAAPAITYDVAPAADASSAPAATIRLTGAIPPGARTLAWSYGWTFASYALAIRHAASDAPATEWLEGGEISRPFALNVTPPSVSRVETAFRYLALGFTHIVPYGFDHVLFVLGLFLLGGGARSVLWQVTAFTVAHSITLGLSMFGLLAAPPALVEPLIAVSIAYVAIENLFLRELRSWRVALVFAFGLLHGLGFAGALKELGLPRSEFLTALVTFNLGVESGQMFVIACAFLLVGWHCGARPWYRRRIVVPASLLIACTAVYWTIERLR